MRVCIFTNHFYPEDFKVNDIAFELAKKGYSITVITAVPDYPQGKFYDSYSWFKRRKESVKGVKVIRLPVIPRGNGGKIELALNYLSYLIAALCFIFFHAYIYDAVFVHLTSPFFIGFPAVILKRRQHIPLIFWTLDLWPESLSAAGGIKNKMFLYLQVKLVQYVYNNCDRILIGSQGFGKSICEKGNYNDKLIYFPNWAESISPANDALKYKHTDPFVNFTKDDFIILFAGNIGEAQNLDAAIEAANLTEDVPEIKWVFLGDGRCRNQLERKAAGYSLQNTVFFPGRFPLEAMPVFMERADILLVSLKDEPIFNLTVPAKVQFYMAQGKPVLGMLNGDGAELIAKANCGCCVPAGDYKQCAEMAKRIFKYDKEKLQSMGRNGKGYYERCFQKMDRINQLETIFNERI